MVRDLLLRYTSSLTIFLVDIKLDLPCNKRLLHSTVSQDQDKVFSGTIVLSDRGKVEWVLWQDWHIFEYGGSQINVRGDR